MGELGIAVSSDFREEGIGQKLLTLVEQHAKDLGLKALFLLGYKKVGMLPKAYEYKGELVDSITMWKEI